ncbi:serine endopeptidase [Massilia sp. PAMC28688]|uniref:serine endopeptidase n=1 Tax=Massilia sp. PAMC28688 TaxID=2861283 RepID=UPI001C6389CE|nr:serine endopeptidase [Massilia sp. PAMC28688]QYF94143.1 serine endopeptidase [Massilia sp. PAMC28688]
MGQLLRLTNTWVQAALWLVAAVFAAFLIGLGGKLLDKLWEAERPLTLQQFSDPTRSSNAQHQLHLAEARVQSVRMHLEQARHKLGVAKTNTTLARQNFDLWLASRDAAARPDQESELLIRTSELDQVRAAEQATLAAVRAQEQALLQAIEQRDQASRHWSSLERAALAALEQARWHQQMQAFLYRLAITAPLVLLACWLFIKKRGSHWWPFIWGYIFFAAFTFFVELVPHVPAYSGYVRYIVGIVITVLVGRFAILSLQAGDAAGAGSAPAACPACARPTAQSEEQDYCPHCGTRLFNSCGKCKTRKTAFARFCTACGTPSVADGA